MDRIKINVPSNLRYISDWEGYEIPYGKCIIDKKVCGCGYTQFCLNNTDNVILCSPRLSLLENKAEQNPHCFYFQPIELKKREQNKLNLKTPEEISNYFFNLHRDQVFNYLEFCKMNSSPVKFLTTYDSFPKLIEILKILGVGLMHFKIIVDEFQLIFSDARFKAEVEWNFVSFLNNPDCVNTCFLSSTPMLDEYLEQLSQFNDSVYYEFCWDSHQIILPNISKVKTDNLEQSLMEIIGLYKEGKGPVKVIDGVEYKSKEAVFYVNNVSLITNIIKRLDLKPSEVNIIVSKNLDNHKKIKKCGRGFAYGRIPLKGESHKMFTFCTSTAFCGVDMYSTNAKSYVFSDCNLDTMALDISIELPQIIGRQRLKENVFRYDVVFYYKTCIKEFSSEDFRKKIEEKDQSTVDMIESFDTLQVQGKNINQLRELIRAGIEMYQYSKDFVSIDKSTGRPVKNNLIYLSDIRAWELQNKIYEDDLSVLRVLETVGEISSSTDFLNDILSKPYFDEKLKDIALYIKDHPEDIDKIPEKYKTFLDQVSLDHLVTGSTRKSDLERKIKYDQSQKVKTDPQTISEVYTLFQIGEVYLKKEIKTNLCNILSKYDIKPKASDIMQYFEVSRAQVLNKITGKRDEGYKLLKKKY